MRTMQGEAGENESLGQEDEGTYPDSIIETILRFIGWAAVTDTLNLHVLHSFMRICQALARLFGSWALEFEYAYNQYVDSLH